MQQTKAFKSNETLNEILSNKYRSVHKYTCFFENFVDVVDDLPWFEKRPALDRRDHITV